MEITSSEIGQLARDLFAADEQQGEARGRVDLLLDSLFPGWRPRHPIYLGWQASRPNRIDVFEVSESVESVAALDGLARAGFTHAMLHPHTWYELGECECPIHVTTPRG